MGFTSSFSDYEVLYTRVCILLASAAATLFGNGHYGYGNDPQQQRQQPEEFYECGGGCREYW
jgi:hypothetical protein